jgi:hypothetical protein
MTTTTDTSESSEEDEAKNSFSDENTEILEMDHLERSPLTMSWASTTKGITLSFGTNPCSK